MAIWSFWRRNGRAAAAPRAKPAAAEAAPRAAAPRQPQQDDIGLEIPTFLRRQSNN